MTDKILVLTTAGSEEQATKIARELIERRLAACVNISSQINAIYRWQGKIEEAREYLLIIKSDKKLFPEISAAIGHLHSYEVPECLAIPVCEGSVAYLNWMQESLQSNGK